MEAQEIELQAGVGLKGKDVVLVSTGKVNILGSIVATGKLTIQNAGTGTIPGTGEMAGTVNLNGAVTAGSVEINADELYIQAQLLDSAAAGTMDCTVRRDLYVASTASVTGGAVIHLHGGRDVNVIGNVASAGVILMEAVGRNLTVSRALTVPGGLSLWARQGVLALSGALTSIGTAGTVDLNAASITGLAAVTAPGAITITSGANVATTAALTAKGVLGLVSVKAPNVTVGTLVEAGDAIRLEAVISGAGTGTVITNAELKSGGQVELVGATVVVNNPITAGRRVYIQASVVARIFGKITQGVTSGPMPVLGGLGGVGPGAGSGGSLAEGVARMSRGGLVLDIEAETMERHHGALMSLFAF